MARPLNPAEVARYEAKLATLRARMRGDGRTGRITAADMHRACVAAGHPISYRYLHAVLAGAKQSRPALHLVSAAMGAIRAARSIPNWLWRGRPCSVAHGAIG